MKIIYKLLLILNYLAWGFIDLCAWNIEKKYGLMFLLPLLFFPIFIIVVNKMAISIQDKICMSEWEVILKKLKWINNACLATIVVVAFIDALNTRGKSLP